ncbi:DUF3558 family protein [Gordonia phthalatica]|uniref:DUF3558 family protein n=1 Tax=Gordonia phthalatica TaxID=1136941 RepID=UPI0012FF2AF0
MQRSRRGLGFAALVLCAITGCSNPTETRNSVPSSSAKPTLRQVDDAGVRLPFDTKFPDRWNQANNGTRYEPCTALLPTELARLGVDATSVRDAAGTNAQTLRGCEWAYRGTEVPARWFVSQFVGNSVGLEEDKRKKSSETYVWLPDVRISGRTAGVHYTASGRYCVTYVQSGRAAVNTMVSVSGRTPPPPSKICDRALAFTRATIGKMPL